MDNHCGRSISSKSGIAGSIIVRESYASLNPVNFNGRALRYEVDMIRTALACIFFAVPIIGHSQDMSPRVVCIDSINKGEIYTRTANHNQTGWSRWQLLDSTYTERFHSLVDTLIIDNIGLYSGCRIIEHRGQYESIQAGEKQYNPLDFSTDDGRSRQLRATPTWNVRFDKEVVGVADLRESEDRSEVRMIEHMINDPDGVIKQYIDQKIERALQDYMDESN